MTVQIQAKKSATLRRHDAPFCQSRCPSLLQALMRWQIKALRAERDRLAHEKNLLRTLVDAIPDQIFFKDSAFRFLCCNKAFADFAGCEESALIGKTSDEVFLEAFLSGDALGGMCGPDDASLPEGGISLSEDWITFPDGRRGQVETLRITCTDAQGELLGVLGLSRDISRHKDIEDELRCDHEAALASDRAKTQFLARMSHEIRTPMNGIIGMTYLALEASPPQEHRRYYERIQYSATSLLRIINDILDLSKMDADKMEIDRVCYNVELLLTRLLEGFESQAKIKGLKLELHLNPDVPDLLFGDPMRVNQILLNLMSNAFKFTSKGFISLLVSTVERQSGSPMLHFILRDTGIGMSRDLLANLFSPFAQGGAHIARNFGGTGLGLVISRHLARLMGGDIRVESVPEEGSTFHLYLPLEVGQSEIQAPAPAPQQDRKNLFRGFHVLLVEDNDISQEIAIAMLERMGLAVDLAENGEQAVAKSADCLYDAILMDIQMPIMDGLTATHHIRRQPGRDLVPVLAMTANAMVEDRTASLEAGMNDFISKPFSPEALQQTLHKWLFRDTQ